MSLAIVDPEGYTQQLEKKTQRIQSLFQPFATPDLEVFSSAPIYYRMRAEFRIWHDNKNSYYRMFNPETKEPFNVKDFPAGSQRIGQLMPLLMDNIAKQQVLKHRLFQVEFLTTQTGEALITLLYHKPLSEAWIAAAKILELQMDIAIIGRSRKQREVLTKDYVTEVLTVDEKKYYYQQVENSFTQPNAGINEKMLTWASSCSKSSKGDLLELYCGNGNFTCVLAPYFNKVLATEVSKVSVASAQKNFKINAIDNAKVIRLSSEELTQAIAGERVFRRLKDIDLKSYCISTIFVDPPRAGLDKGTEMLTQQFDHILYISCNPETLKANLHTISQTHSIKRIALFDQFPYTDHTEMGVYLVRQ